MTPDQFRAKAKELYRRAQKGRDPEEGLMHVLRAMELEDRADAMQREGATVPKPH